MTLHAVGEGCGVGVSFGGPTGFPKGLLLAVATVLASKNVGKKELTLWTIATALPQALVAVPAYMFVQVFSSLFPFFAGFAAGCMIWISFAEIIPDALENVSPSTLATATTTSTFAFKATQYSLDALVFGGKGAWEDLRLRMGITFGRFVLVVCLVTLAFALGRPALEKWRKSTARRRKSLPLRKHTGAMLAPAPAGEAAWEEKVQRGDHV